MQEVVGRSALLLLMNRQSSAGDVCTGLVCGTESERGGFCASDSGGLSSFRVRRGVASSCTMYVWSVKAEPSGDGLWRSPDAQTLCDRVHSVIAVGWELLRELCSMRWYWIDRFIEFESGKRAKSVKNVSLAEEHLHDHFPGFPVMPGSLMIEGMAQTGGILLGEHFGFRYNVILAKVPKVTFHSWACPGDQLVYSAELLDAREEGGSATVQASVGDRAVATAEIVFAHLKTDDPQFSRIDQKNFVFRMNLLDILTVGKAGPGASST